MNLRKDFHAASDDNLEDVHLEELESETVAPLFSGDYPP